MMMMVMVVKLGWGMVMAWKMLMGKSDDDAYGVVHGYYRDRNDGMY